MANLEVRSAADSDRQAVIGVITLAFANDPMARWAFPDPATYMAAMPEFAVAFGGNGFAHGSSHLVADGMGAAMWLPPGVQPDGERMMALVETHLPSDRLDDMGKVLEQMDAFHPEGSCWYLPLIGVDPTRQGSGYGSALLRHALEQCDREGMPAYLESSNPRNVPLYERHGFEAIGTIQAGTSPAMTPMLRRPR